MAQPIRREAGFLYDRAVRAFRPHPAHRSALHRFTPSHPTTTSAQPPAHLSQTRKTRSARRAKRPRQGWRGRSAGKRDSFAIGQCGSFVRTQLTAAPSTASLHHRPPLTAAPPQCSLHQRQKKRQAGFPLACRFGNESQLTSDKLLFVFSRVVFVFRIRFRCNLFIVDLRFRRDIFLAFRYAPVD